MAPLPFCGGVSGIPSRQSITSSSSVERGTLCSGLGLGSPSEDVAPLPFCGGVSGIPSRQSITSSSSVERGTLCSGLGLGSPSWLGSACIASCALLPPALWVGHPMVNFWLPALAVAASVSLGSCAGGDPASVSGACPSVDPPLICPTSAAPSAGFILFNSDFIPSFSFSKLSKCDVISSTCIGLVLGVVAASDCGWPVDSVLCSGFFETKFSIIRQLFETKFSIIR